MLRQAATAAIHRDSRYLLLDLSTDRRAGSARRGWRRRGGRRRRDCRFRGAALLREQPLPHRRIVVGPGPGFVLHARVEGELFARRRLFIASISRVVSSTGTTGSASPWKAQIGTFNARCRPSLPPPQMGCGGEQFAVAREQVPGAEAAHREAGDVDAIGVDAVSSRRHRSARAAPDWSSTTRPSGTAAPPQTRRPCLPRRGTAGRGASPSGVGSALAAAVQENQSGQLWSLAERS